MRIHSDILTATDVHDATRSQGMGGVAATVSEHGSRTHAHALEVTLTGTSSRRGNTGSRGARGGNVYGGDDYAATWDEWGMVLASLFLTDPRAIVGSVKRPIYAGAEHFVFVTASRYLAGTAHDGWVPILTAPYQHGGPGHRWQSAAGYRVCQSCEAELWYTDPAPYLAYLAAPTLEEV